MILVWTGLLKPIRNLILQTYFADVSVETLGGVADCPFLCQYYSRNTDCLQSMAPHSQTTILDERLSIHCNSSCLYNRCGSTDVYVLYSRVHFYYLQIKDCVEEDDGFFKRSGLNLFWSRCSLKVLFILKDDTESQNQPNDFVTIVQKSTINIQHLIWVEVIHSGWFVCESILVWVSAFTWTDPLITHSAQAAAATLWCNMGLHVNLKNSWYSVISPFTLFRNSSET